MFAAAYLDRSRGSRQREYGLALLNNRGRIVTRHRLPGRGHGVAHHVESRQTVVFARRPGSFGLAVEFGGKYGAIPFETMATRHFYGHGTFSSEGQLLFATENDLDSGNGVIGLYAAKDQFKRVGEFSSFGTGPHEIALHPDRRTLCVANGGIETHPDSGKAKLNLDTMRPNIAFIDAKNGSLLSKHELPRELNRVSVRHIAFDRHGVVWVGAQNEGNAMDTPPLVACVKPDEGLEILHLDEETTALFANYIGSVAANADGSRIAVTSPRGSSVVIFDAEQRKPVVVARLDDVCGVAGDGAQFVFSSASGTFGASDTALSWDNHIGFAYSMFAR